MRAAASVPRSARDRPWAGEGPPPSATSRTALRQSDGRGHPPPGGIPQAAWKESTFAESHRIASSQIGGNRVAMNGGRPRHLPLGSFLGLSGYSGPQLASGVCRPPAHRHSPDAGCDLSRLSAQRAPVGCADHPLGRGGHLGDRRGARHSVQLRPPRRLDVAHHPAAG